MTFSNGTVAGYVVEELLELRPHRELNLMPLPLNTSIPAMIATKFDEKIAIGKIKKVLEE